MGLLDQVVLAPPKVLSEREAMTDESPLPCPISPPLPERTRPLPPGESKAVAVLLWEVVDVVKGRAFWLRGVCKHFTVHNRRTGSLTTANPVAYP